VSVDLKKKATKKSMTLLKSNEKFKKKKKKKKRRRRKQERNPRASLTLSASKFASLRVTESLAPKLRGQLMRMNAMLFSHDSVVASANEALSSNREQTITWRTTR
jgi:hypothetical protein